MHYETVMVNCNPETVSTDYDTSTSSTSEPLTVEDVAANLSEGTAQGRDLPVRRPDPAQYRRQLEEAGVNILGTPPAVIDLAERPRAVQ